MWKVDGRGCKRSCVGGKVLVVNMWSWVGTGFCGELESEE